MVYTLFTPYEPPLHQTKTVFNDPEMREATVILQELPITKKVNGGILLHVSTNRQATQVDGCMQIWNELSITKIVIRWHSVTSQSVVAKSTGSRQLI